MPFCSLSRPPFLDLCHRLAGLCAVLCLLTGAAQAASVNLDAQVNSGASPTLVELALDAGDYEVIPIEDQFIAMSYWSATLGCNADGICSTGWHVGYEVVDGIGMVLAANPFDFGEIFATPEQALAHARGKGPIAFTLDTPQSIFFSIPDNNVSDNRGGVSLSVTSAAPVPLPPGMLLLATALGGFGLLRHRKTG